MRLIFHLFICLFVDFALLKSVDQASVLCHVAKACTCGNSVRVLVRFPFNWQPRY